MMIESKMARVRTGKRNTGRLNLGNRLRLKRQFNGTSFRTVCISPPLGFSLTRRQLLFTSKKSVLFGRLDHARTLLKWAGLVALTVAAGFGQTQDTSGNGLLKGTYAFRHLAVQIVDSNNDPTDMTAVYGTITFDGAGNYTVSATSIDNGVSNGAPQPLTQSGTYAIGANGAGYLTNELYPTDPNAFIYGALAQGVYTGSSTESEQDTNELNDMFIAIPLGPAPTNAGFTSSYQTGVIDFPGADSSSIKNALFELQPDGKGGFATINLTGQAADQSNPNITQSISGATYSFNADGSATLTIPAATGVDSTEPLFTGTKTIYQSADGNFILGWTANDFDIFVGVKALAVTGTNTLSQGLYFTAALEDTPGLGADSYYGGTSNSGDINGDGVIHQRLNLPGLLSKDYGTNDQIVLNADGTPASIPSATSTSSATAPRRSSASEATVSSPCL